MRVPAWFLFGLFLSIILFDFTAVWTVRNRIITAVEHSLDAALIGAINEETYQSGEMLADEWRGREEALKCLMDNLRLDSRLENEVLSNTVFNLEYLHYHDKQGVAIFFKTYIKAMSPRVLGLEGIPVQIHKKQYHISKYK